MAYLCETCAIYDLTNEVSYDTAMHVFDIVYGDELVDKKLVLSHFELEKLQECFNTQCESKLSKE